MSLIDGPRFAEFLDTYKGQSIPRKTINPNFTKNKVEKQLIRNLLKKLGIQVAREPEQKTLEVFLLRSLLYRIDKIKPDNLNPYLVSDNWSNYVRSWRLTIGDRELHVPFRGKIAFLCDDEGIRKWICHPESSEQVDKIYIQTGELTLPYRELGWFKKRICAQILENFRLPELTAENLKEIEQRTGIKPDSFLTALVGLKLAVKKDSNYLLTGKGPFNGELFLTEIEKTQGDTDLEKVAKIFLRRDHMLHYMHISTILAWLESQEKVQQPYAEPVGAGKEEKEQFKDIVDYCSLNIRAVRNVVYEYSKFGAFLEWYPREYLDPRMLKWTRECYCFLSCSMDSLGLLATYFNSNEVIKQFFKTDFKLRKLGRHAEYLSRFITKEEISSATDEKNFNSLKERLVKSEILDFNPELDELKSLVNASVDEAQCPYNIFVVSKVPVKESVFKDEFLGTLKNERKFRESQGHFYYPDFRFILSSKLGLSFRAFDNILAYILSKDVDFRSRLWLPVAFGIKIKKHKIEDGLLSVVGEPFDSIALRY